MVKEFCIATLGSHSALQILKGARDEGFRTICICIKGKEKPYTSFRVADEIISIDNFNDFFSIEHELIKKNAILIPHASLISYIGPENINKIKMNYFGDREILSIESDRDKQESWLKSAGLNVPKVFKKPEDIDRPCIVKFHGAAGGKGYFIVNNKEDFYRKIDRRKDFIIQENIVGVPIYIHYFYSAINQELELMGFDKRYETNIDAIGRIPSKDQFNTNVEPSYIITGNMPLVIRESLLPEVFEMGERIIHHGKKLTRKGLFGPFCLETILTPDLKFFAFEISARIVAGTNLYPEGSQYTCYRYDKPMSTGRRIASEIKEAIKRDEFERIIG